MAKKSKQDIRPEMQGKALCFVGGSTRPTVAPVLAPYVLRHPDGSPMVAESTSDTVAACRDRFAKGNSSKPKGAPKATREAEANAAAEAAELAELEAELAALDDDAGTDESNGDGEQSDATDIDASDTDTTEGGDDDA